MAPRCETAAAVAMKVWEGRITSSPGLTPAADQRQVQRGRAGIQAHGVLHPAKGGEIGLKALHLLAEDEAGVVDDALDGGVDLGLDGCGTGPSGRTSGMAKRIPPGAHSGLSRRTTRFSRLLVWQVAMSLITWAGLPTTTAPGRDIPGHHGAGADQRAPADADARQHGDVGPELGAALRCRARPARPWPGASEDSARWSARHSGPASTRPPAR